MYEHRIYIIHINKYVRTVPQKLFRFSFSMSVIAYTSRKYVVRNFMIFLKLAISYELLSYHVLYKPRRFSEKISNANFPSFRLNGHLDALSIPCQAQIPREHQYIA
jgi:hypothetical protein